jgi:hypothetical protein
MHALMVRPLPSGCRLTALFDVRGSILYLLKHVLTFSIPLISPSHVILVLHLVRIGFLGQNLTEDLMFHDHRSPVPLS